MDKIMYPDGTGEAIIGFNVSEKDRELTRHKRNDEAWKTHSLPIEQLFDKMIPEEKGGL